jgi:tRNA dimethylallyltransferase
MIIDDTPLPPMPRYPVVAIFGPTGVGKTAVAIALAELLRAEGEDPAAVSADALQVYAGLETVTGAATAAERALLEHRLVGILPVDRTFSAGEYAARAHAEIDALLDAGRRPIVLGGTGLYLRAALADLDLRPPPRPGARERWLAELERRGVAALHAVLGERDPEAAARIAPSDSQRIVRALELLDAGERPPAGPQLWTSATRHPTLLAGLVMERAALYERIDARVEAMVAAGAIEEVRRADAAGASATARRAIGFAELLSGDVEAMKRRSRNYARRQLTWMRKLPEVHVLDVTGRGAQDVASELRSALRTAADSGSGPTKRANGPTNAQ